MAIKDELFEELATARDFFLGRKAKREKVALYTGLISGACSVPFWVWLGIVVKVAVIASALTCPLVCAIILTTIAAIAIITFVIMRIKARNIQRSRQVRVHWDAQAGPSDHPDVADPLLPQAAMAAEVTIPHSTLRLAQVSSAAQLAALANMIAREARGIYDIANTSGGAQLIRPKLQAFEQLIANIRGHAAEIPDSQHKTDLLNAADQLVTAFRQLLQTYPQDAAYMQYLDNISFRIAQMLIGQMQGLIHVSSNASISRSVLETNLQQLAELMDALCLQGHVPPGLSLTVEGIAEQVTQMRREARAGQSLAANLTEATPLLTAVQTTMTPLQNLLAIASAICTKELQTIVPPAPGASGTAMLASVQRGDVAAATVVDTAASNSVTSVSAQPDPFIL
jgi:hypothetical protein